MDTNTIREYFTDINTTVLPTTATEYIKSEILSDKDLDLLDVNDEDFLAVKQLIAESYPLALLKEIPSEPPIEETQEEEQLIVQEQSLEDKIKSAENTLKGYKIKAKYAKGDEAEKAQKVIKAFELRLKMLLKKVSKGEAKEEVVELASGGGVAKDKFQVGQIVMINAKPKTEDFEINFADYIGKELVIKESLGGNLYRTTIKSNGQDLPYLLSADELEQH